MARVLVLDQSTTICGWALIDDHLKGKKALIDSGFIKPKLPNNASYELRCMDISAHISIKFEQEKCEYLVLEDTSKGHYKSPDIGYKMGVISGCIIASVLHMVVAFNGSNRVALLRYQPVKSRKSAVTGNGNAKKEEVQMAVTKLFGLQFYPQEDQADALAGAWMWLQEKGKV